MARDVTVGTKFALPVSVAILLLGITTALLVRQAVQSSLDAELHRRSQALVAELALRATSETLRDDVVGLDEAVQDFTARDDVAYAVVIGTSGHVLASSFPTGVPDDLVTLFETARPHEALPVSFRSERGVVNDYVGRMIEGRLGIVHLGVDQLRIRALAHQQGQLVLGLTSLAAVAAGLIAVLTAHLVTQPLRQLAAAASQVGTEDVRPPSLPDRADEVGELARSFEEMLDRLDQKQAQIEVANRLVVQAERLAVVGKLASGVAHEIGNPLHAGRQFLEALKEHPERSERYVDLLDQAFERTDRVISQLLSYSAEQELELRSTEPGPVVEQALDFLRYDHRTRDVELRVELQPDLPRVRLDTSAIQQVLVNLVVNALDALEGHGSIVVSGRRERDDRGRLHVVLGVADSGPGVPAELAPRLFDPFFTTKEPGQGTGLGLSVSQDLVAAQGGRLVYLPGPQGGACFEIWLGTEENA